jgi:hypothetical protein
VNQDFITQFKNNFALPLYAVPARKAKSTYKNVHSTLIFLSDHYSTRFQSQSAETQEHNLLNAHHRNYETRVWPQVISFSPTIAPHTQSAPLPSSSFRYSDTLKENITGPETHSSQSITHPGTSYSKRSLPSSPLRGNAHKIIIFLLHTTNPL